MPGRDSKPSSVPTVSWPLTVLLSVGSMILTAGTVYGVMSSDIEHIQATVNHAGERREEQYEKLGRSVGELQRQQERNATRIEAQSERLGRIERDVGVIRDAVVRPPRRR